MKVELDADPRSHRKSFYALTKPDDVARLLEVDPSKLAYHLFVFPEERKYTEFRIQKRRGGHRVIRAPSSPLKILQRKLATVLLRVYSPKRPVHGFVRDRSIITNATAHARQRFVLNVDLRDFFPSINFGRVRGMFMGKPYELPHQVATVLAQLCCYRNELPQGAPTSPIVSNMLCRKLDGDLQCLATETAAYYTRYADDVTFSTNLPAFPARLAHLSDERVELGHDLVMSIEDNGFEINLQKVRLQHKPYRREVTGLVVNDFPNVRRKYVRRTSSMIHALGKHGLNAAANEHKHKYALHNRSRRPGKATSSFADMIRGRIEFIGQVRGKDDPVYRRLFVRFRKALGEEEPLDDGLAELRAEFAQLQEMSDHQKRGVQLEYLLVKLFDWAAIEVYEPFHRNERGEQIDGAFRMEGWYYLTECKWQEQTSNIRELDGLKGKLDRSGKRSMGLFLSIGGFSRHVVGLLKQGSEKNVMLMDGDDLQAVFDGKIALGRLLREKEFALNVKTEPLRGVDEMLGGKG